MSARLVHRRAATIVRTKTAVICFSRRFSESAAASASTSRPPIIKTGPRISTVFAALLILGVGTTTYGVYDFYTSMTLWPPEVRADLRAGIKSKHQGDLAISERYLRRAWEMAQTLPPEKFAPDPFLKVSGIGIALAGVLEQHNAPKEAYEMYSDVLQVLQRQAQRLTGEERMRAVAVACKLGEMAEEYQQPAEDEERWLSWAVTELLKIVKDAQKESSEVEGNLPVKAEAEASRVVLSELDLPAWVSRKDIGAPFEALGAFYARTGKVEYALPLYLQAISILIPPPGHKPSSSEDRCRGAQLMNNLSELLIRDSPTPERLHQAEEWAKQALAVIEKTTESVGGRPSMCEQALAAVLFNLGSLREMANDHSAAREMFTAGLNHSKAIGMKQGIMEARTALRRLDRLSIPSDPAKGVDSTRAENQKSDL